MAAAVRIVAWMPIAAVSLMSAVVPCTLITASLVSAVDDR